MKEQILQNIDAVIGALNNVSVCGEENLANLAGSLRVLHQIGAMLQNAEFSEPEKKNDGDAEA
jgi:hypothetical protein